MKLSAALALSMAGSAMAFAPEATRSASTVSLHAEMPDRLWNSMVDKTERSAAIPFLPRAVNLDGTAPGDYGFDPFFLSSIPKNFAGFIQPPSWEGTDGIDTIYWMREAETKHGRVAMLAVSGWIVTDLGVRFPGADGLFKNIPDSYHAHDILVEQGTMSVMLLFIGFLEFCSSAALVQVSKGELEREPGDFMLDNGILEGRTPEFVMDMKTKEINNGRLAMLAFGGIATQTALGEAHTGFPYF